jgi:hypothetical protein
MLIKEAVQSLYDKKQITEQEYKLLNDNLPELEKTAGVTIHIPGASISEGAQASAPHLMKSIWEIAKQIAAGGAVATGGVLAGVELDKYLKSKRDIENSYNAMNEKVPALTEYPQDKIKDYFEVIKTFSPRSASNPLVAGALVHKMLEFGGVDHKLVQDLARMEMPQQSLAYEYAKSGLGGLAQPPKFDKND